MSLDTEVSGDPDACRATVTRLARLASAVDEAGDCLTRQAHLADADFGGLSGDTFRDHAARLAAAGDRTTRRCTRLACALSGLALDLDEARSLMGSAREAARPWLAVGATTISPPAVDPRADDPWAEQAWSAWRQVVLLVDRAREVEHRAQHSWRTALAQLTGAAAPAAPWDLDDITDGEWPDADDAAAAPHLLPGHAPAPPPPPAGHPHQHRRRHHDVAGQAATTPAPAAPAAGAAPLAPQRGGHGSRDTSGCGVVPTWRAGVGRLPDDTTA
jgi:hypothetical protein